MSRRISAAKRIEMTEQFKKMDKDKDNKLSFDELKQMLQAGNPNLSTEDLRKLYRKIDKNNDGTIDFEELLDYLYSDKQPEVVPAPDEVRERFDEFCGESCDQTEFRKMMLDCGVVDGKFKEVDIATHFNKVKARGVNRIDLSQFEKACCNIAAKKEISAQAMYGLIVGGSKKSSGTVAQANRFHDDKSSYTGSHAKNDKIGPAGGETESDRHDRLAAKAQADAAGQGAEISWEGCEDLFRKYDQDNNGLDSTEFSRILKDAKLYNKFFTKNDVDLIFRAVALKDKKVGVDKFKEMLRKVAVKRKCPIAEVQTTIGNMSGPIINATKADAVRLNDDKSTFTGSHATDGRHTGAGSGETGSTRHERLSATNAGDFAGQEIDWGGCEATFNIFDPQANGLDQTEFKKMIEDCGLIDGKLKKPDVDIVFQECVGQGQRKINFEKFQTACRKMAKRKHVETAEIQSVVQSTTKTLHGTQADFVRMHDDKDTYTGMHAGK